MNKAACIVAVAGIAGAASATTNPYIALEDFDGGDVNLSSSSVINQDGGGGDWWGVGEIGAWPQSAGVPFNLADDSVFPVSGGSVFAGDDEGIFGQNRDVNDAFFGISDSDEFGAAQTASWTFNTAGFTDLRFAVDFGAVADIDDFGGFGNDKFVDFEIIADGSPVGTLSFGPGTFAFTQRLMDSGNPAGNAALQAASGLGVTKFDASTGLAAGNLFTDKATVADGALDTFETGVFALSANTVEIRVTGDFAFEGAAFDNVGITGIPTPGALALLGLGGLAAARRRRA